MYTGRLNTFSRIVLRVAVKPPPTKEPLARMKVFPLILWDLPSVVVVTASRVEPVSSVPVTGQDQYISPPFSGNNFLKH